MWYNPFPPTEHSTRLDHVSCASLKPQLLLVIPCHPLQPVGAVVKSEQVQDQGQPGRVKTHGKQGASSLSPVDPVRMRED